MGGGVDDRPGQGERAENERRGIVARARGR